MLTLLTRLLTVTVTTKVLFRYKFSKPVLAEEGTAQMNHGWIGLVPTLSVTGNICCTKKSGARNQVKPIIEKVNHLDDETGKDTYGIKHTDVRYEQDMQALMTRTDQAARQADVAG